VIGIFHGRIGIDWGRTTWEKSVTKIKGTFVECTQCGTKFRCPFHIPDTKTFFHATLWGARVKCPHCDVILECTAGNMSYEPDESETADHPEDAGGSP
jgi:hypothetical protein